ncbi:MAG TPA: MXAN_6577-like cysteine-rich protein [Vulgatibacter sp.]|nr:MXAN_6577-like cysteine-rich protein [Vulgatibacter sp.]
MKRIPLVCIALFGMTLTAWFGCADPVAECDSPAMFCDGICVTPAVDRNNCGACGNSCSANLVCSDGACVCPAGKELCDGRCVDVRTDSLHCGGCGNACETGTFCLAGECGCDGEDCACPGEVCDDVCVDTSSDALHCGACGNACGDGQHCVAGSCAAGDLFAACFQSGRIVPFLKESGQPSGTIASGIEGPQSLALLGDRHLVAVGGMDGILYVFDRATMEKVGSVNMGEEGGGRMSNQVLVRGGRAYVVNSGVNTVQVIDLSNPEAPSTLYEVSTGEGSNPALAAFDEEGTLWVTLLMMNEVVPVTVGEGGGAVGDAIALPTDGLGPNPFPGQLVIRDGTIYVAMNNLGTDYAPFGNGVLAVVDVSSAEATAIDLGSDCRNPGFLHLEGDELQISCTGAYGEDDGAIAFVSLADDSVRTVSTGGGPTRLARSGHLYAADSAGSTYVAIDDEGTVSRHDACPVAEFEFVSDVLAIP